MGAPFSLVNAARRCGHWMLLIGLACVQCPAFAQGVFTVNLPWALPAAKGKPTEAFMVLQSSDGAALVGVRSDAAASVGIVAAGTKAATMDRLPLPRGEEVQLAPGKIRFRLLAIDKTLKLGDRVPLVLTIEAADGVRRDIAVDVEVRRRSALDDERRAHKH